MLFRLLRYVLRAVAASWIFIWGAIAQRIWRTEVPSRVKGWSPGKGPGGRSSWSSLQTLFTDFDCQKDQNLRNFGTIHLVIRDQSVSRWELSDVCAHPSHAWRCYCLRPQCILHRTLCTTLKGILSRVCAMSRRSAQSVYTTKMPSTFNYLDVAKKHSTVTPPPFRISVHRTQCISNTREHHVPECVCVRVGFNVPLDT